LIEWVYTAAIDLPMLDRVVVATPDEEIRDAVLAFGGSVELTADKHPSGTDRVAEVAERDTNAEIVLNVQGDQPMVHADAIAALLEPMHGSSVEMATVAGPLDPERSGDPSVVKVVCDLNGDALYFSRSAIPYSREGAARGALHHLGMYAFRRAFLLEFASWAPTPLERAEGLEQLRALEHGRSIRVEEVAVPMVEINGPDDLESASRVLGTR
jgi:3-deoxy-manno-octulosonate cytidylyltransferase (CMP-KDO synthetase)